MKKSWIYIMVATVFCWCSCQDPSWELDETQPEVVSDRIPVTLQASFGTSIENETGFVPMGTRGGSDTIYTILNNLYKAVVAKKIDQKWILDTIVDTLVNREISRKSSINVIKSTTFDPLYLELRPGIYRVTLFFNSSSLVWDSGLRPGTVVEDGSGAVYCAGIYWVSTFWADKGFRTLARREIFTGTVDFEVNKTTNLHSSSLDPLQVKLERKNTCFRVLLKEDPSSGHEFGPTQITVTANFVADEGQYFPDGLDVWGNPWYDKNNLSDTLSLRTSALNLVEGYLISNEANTTLFSPYLIMPEEGIHCQLYSVTMTGQSNEDFQNYKLKDNFKRNYVLKNDYIDGIVLSPTKETYLLSTGDSGVYLQVVDEDPVDLFGRYMEWNIK